MRPRAGPHAVGPPKADAGLVGLRVLIVDDQPAFRALARDLLQLGGYEVVGDAADGGSAIAASERLRPDIVLLDVQLPDVDGFAVAAQLSTQDNAPAVVLTSSRDLSAYRRRLASSPARGFIPKAELSAAALALVVG
jgi:DNA-binding NarL/FixJ family response regulator